VALDLSKPGHEVRAFDRDPAAGRTRGAVSPSAGTAKPIFKP
jgi:hypothetical protein